MTDERDVDKRAVLDLDKSSSGLESCCGETQQKLSESDLVFDDPRLELLVKNWGALSANLFAHLKQFALGH